MKDDVDMIPNVCTDAVSLRAMEPEDLDFLYGMENDRELWNVGNTSVPYSRYVLHDYIANATNDIYRDGQVRFVVCNANGDTVGLADVFDFNPQHRRAEVSIAIHRDHRRRGYAQAAIAHILAYAHRTLHLHQLYAVVASDNEASLALFLKCGFNGCNSLKEWLFDGNGYKDAVVMNKIF